MKDPDYLLIQTPSYETRLHLDPVPELECKVAESIKLLRAGESKEVGEAKRLLRHHLPFFSGTLERLPKRSPREQNDITGSIWKVAQEYYSVDRTLSESYHDSMWMCISHAGFLYTQLKDWHLFHEKPSSKHFRHMFLAKFSRTMAQIFDTSSSNTDGLQEAPPQLLCDVYNPVLVYNASGTKQHALPTFPERASTITIQERQEAWQQGKYLHEGD